MTCILNSHEQEELLLGYCQGNLAADRAGAYERHLTECAACLELVALQRQVEEGLEQWEAPEASANFNAQLMARIRASAEAEMPWYRRLFGQNWGWKPAIPVLLAGAALALFLMRPVSVPTGHGEALRAEEIEQVERALDDIEAIQSLQQGAVDVGNQEAL